MNLSVKNTVIFFTLVLFTFGVLSFHIFDNVYNTAKVVVDEEFHLPLGLAYCRYNFSVWDPKVTTLPGLYLISALFLGPFEACSIYWLRFISLYAAVLNVALLYILLLKNNQSIWNNILSAVTLALIPPVYFYSHFYYTDIVSLTTILLMFVFHNYGCHFLSSIFGAVAVLCRQTNIMWVFYLLGQYVLVQRYYILSNTHDKSEKGIPLKNVQVFKKLFVVHPVEILKSLPLQLILDCCCYLSVIITFFLFILINGGIVVGDKTAHEVVIHIPQLFYFSLFSLIFAWPHFVCEVSNFIVFVKHHKKIIFLSFMVCLVIVHYNTVVHPYLLADNRHYTFYIWNRFYGRVPSFRFSMIPVYIFAWYVILKTLFDSNNITHLFVYLVTVIGLLVPQKLIDVRYYFVPYIIFRLHVKNNSYTVFNLILEFVTYIVINVITFNLFFTKLIFWADYNHPQRLIW